MSPIIHSLARSFLVLVLPLVAAGCVSSRAFVPSEHVTGFSSDGRRPAAEYTLLEEGETVADVKVWSDGASRDGSRTVVQVAFEIDNQSREPVRFDEQRIFLEELPEQGKAAGRERAVQVDGDALIPAGESRQLEATFALPDGVYPSDVPGYRVGWTVVGRKAHSRKTPFMYARGPSDPDPWGPVYAPYYYGYYPGSYGPWRYRMAPWRGRYYYSPYYYAPYWR